uniref:DNA-directed DNA polymerase n=1 Tax=Tanacetum cinerariifolium TaxID=118510 RepID=A0A6L2JTG8_TANCI|nr:DNA-directed DNA polymerase [Tanacetum cinerariifolium]
MLEKTMHHHIRTKSRKYTIDKSFTLGSTKAADNVNILQSCNGLLLCIGWGWGLVLITAIYWNDALLWLETENRQLTHYKLNIKDHEHPIITTMPIPQGLQQGRNFFESYGIMLPMIMVIQIPYMLHLEGKLFDSCGCLLLVRRDYICSSDFTIYDDLFGPLFGALFWEKEKKILYWFQPLFNLGDENPIRTLGDYSKASHEGYRNTIELPEGKNVVPLRSDTIRLVQNGCSFHGLRSEDPNQHLKDFLKLVDLLDLDVANRERTGLLLFQFSLRDQASNWLEHFQQDPSPHGRILLLLQVQIFYDHVNPATRRTINQSAGGKLCDRNAKESWALLDDLALYDNESWNDPRDFAKPVKAISLPQDVPSTSDRRLVKLENKVQCLMEAHFAPKQPIQVNKITSSCEICGGPHDTQYCIENPEQAFVDYASSHTDEAGGKWYTFKPEQNNLGLVSNFMASQEARLSKFEADFKQQQRWMTNKIDIVLKAITDRITGALPSDTIKNPKLNINPTALVLPARSYQTGDPRCSSYPLNLINAVKMCSNVTNHSQKDHLQTVTEIRTRQTEEPEKTLEDEFNDLHLNLPVLEVLAYAPMYNSILDKYMESLELGKNRLRDSKPFDTLADLGSCVNIIPLYLFKKLNIGLLEETDHVFGLADGTKSCPVGIVRDVEVHLGRIKLLNDFYVIDMKKDSETSLLVGRGFLVTANAVIDCRKAKIAIVKGIIRDAEINPFKDVLVFRKMVELLGAIPINLKRNMWESDDLIENPINWDKPPNNRDGAWHAKIRLIDPDREEFTKTLQSVHTSRKLSERESPREIIDLDHFYNT